MPAFFRKRSPDGANQTSNCSLLLIIGPEVMKGWVGLVGWPIDFWQAYY